jgi:hypothetical protein
VRVIAAPNRGYAGGRNHSPHLTKEQTFNMAKAFTRLGVEAANKPGRFADGGHKGLYLQVSPRGDGTVTKSYLYRYSFGGKSREMGLGSTLTTSLAEARQAVDKARALIRDTIDPIDARHRKRSEPLAAAVPTQTFAEAWGAAKAHEWKNSASAAAALSPLRRYIFPVLGKVDVRLMDYRIRLPKAAWRARADSLVWARRSCPLSR